MFKVNGKQINELTEGDTFSFKGDNKEYVFGGCDGQYAKVYGSLQDYKKDKNPAFVESATRISA